ncbi:Cyclin [Parasponia andersonii]|uniref:B-like cyclin n=1 Tax=Parasponia andersonii TaxID=3476 RepID=A0A2P5AWB8_PARAD|nr:Cyclin [Parasponia andersonii]
MAMKPTESHDHQEDEEEHQNPSLTLLDTTLYCEEEKWEEEEEESEIYSRNDNNDNNPSLSPLVLLEQDLFWEDIELNSLFSKEEQQKKEAHYLDLEGESHSSSSIHLARREAVDWVLKVNAHYGFTALTAVLAINYLDRFLSSLSFQRDKPWMIQLVAVTCLSLAAKVEETQVPLLLHLQVKDTKYVFEAKTIQRMELIVLSTLQWKMHPVTPLSFLDHIIRRLGLKTHLHWEFLRRCERLLLSVVSDSRFIGYLPSVLATTTMMRVIDNIEPRNAIENKNQLLGVLRLSKEKVEKCYNLITELSNGYDYAYNNPLKRKNELVPSSPSGVIDAIFSSDSSNDSWSVASSSSSVCCSPHGPLFKKVRAEDDNQMRLPSALSRVFVDIVGSPP